MRLGLGLGGLGLDSQGLIEQAKAQGVSGLLLDVSEARQQPIAEWRRQLAENELEVVQVGSWALNPLRPTPQTEEIARDALSAAADLGAPYIILGGGTKNPNHSFCGHPDNFTDKAIAEAAASLKPLAREAEAAGVLVTLEIHFATVLCDWDACRKLIEEIASSALKINLDAANMIRYYDYWSSSDYIRMGIETLGTMIETCHAKDVVMHDALHMHMDECPAGEGCLNYADIIGLVEAHLRPDTYMIVEHTPLDKLPAAMTYIRDSAAKAGVAIF
ncbi:MAG: TIM barrel protein [Chloroflexi bacterium]|nr:TIM barrel protein [Chloroflexota bacterium]